MEDNNAIIMELWQLWPEIKNPEQLFAWVQKEFDFFAWGFASLCQTHLCIAAEGNLPAPNDLQSQLMRELQQQQLMMAISQCNQQLMMQQYDMQALQRQLQQLTGQMAGLQQHIPSTLLPAAPDQLVPQPFTTHSQVGARDHNRRQETWRFKI